MSRIMMFIFFLYATITHTQSTLTGNIMHDGQNRNYRLRLPANHDKNIPIPLVFNMHGFTSNATQQELYSAMNAVADTARFAVCYPNGIGNAWNVGWNFGSTADDVGFISALIDRFHLDYGIDKSAVYACGMSNGGFMSYRLACELNDRIAAIASVTGSMVQEAVDVCKPGKAIPIMEIHGTADQTVNYNGTPNVSVAIPLILKFWQENNGCDADPTITLMPNTNLSDNTTTEKWTYTNCTDDKKVIHLKVINGAHTWPGAPLNLGATSQDFKASVEIWNFFKQYKINTISAAYQDKILEISLRPNPTSDIVQISCPDQSIITIYNANGHAIAHHTNINSALEISTLEWPSGIYFIQIRTGKSTQNQKLIKI
jgi:polyhydroxybutyrate depolymerase